MISLLCLFAPCDVNAQVAQPGAGPAKSVNIPAVKESKLPNGLRVAVVHKPNVPLVTIQLIIKSGASLEPVEKAGLADLTAAMLTKGTKTRSATQIAEEVEFLGGSINSSASWDASTVNITVTTDKIAEAMAILSDVVLNPAFNEKELELLKSQSLDGLVFNLTQPGFLANYVATGYTFGEHPAGGTPDSIKSLLRGDVIDFHSRWFSPANGILIFAGDIDSRAASTLTDRYFGKWTGKSVAAKSPSPAASAKSHIGGGRLLIIDLPNSGQAAVTYAKALDNFRRVQPTYYFPASVLNSVLGGGYSSRLNQEIRIKRGLSYGAGSSFSWRTVGSNFATRTQTKNESAPEVVELVLAELNRLANGEIPDQELVPRKSVLTGGFGRNLETTRGVASALAELYGFGVSTTELNSYTNSVNGVSELQIRNLASKNLLGGDIIIVGDYSKFKDDLAKRFPNMKAEVIRADEIDITKPNLRK